MESPGPQEYVSRPSDPKRVSSRARYLLVVCGFLFVTLAAIGALLPLLPTTPFLLLASACFARSSPRFHERLKRFPLFGKYLDQWDRNRSIPKAAKRKAYALIVIAFAISVLAFDSIVLRIVHLLIGGVLIYFLAKLPTPDNEVSEEEAMKG